MPSLRVQAAKVFARRRRTLVTRRRKLQKLLFTIDAEIDALDEEAARVRAEYLAQRDELDAPTDGRYVLHEPRGDE